MTRPDVVAPWEGRIHPPASDEALPFWDATRDRTLLLQWCTRCRAAIHYPRAACPRCLDDELEWRRSTGNGTIYAVTVEHRPQNPALQGRAPYVVALVDLDEGVRLLTNVVTSDPDDVHVGAAVEVVWEPLPDGRHLPLFRPAAG